MHCKNSKHLRVHHHKLKSPDCCE